MPDVEKASENACIRNKLGANGANLVFFGLLNLARD
jgi:hypothetical protein